MSNIFTQAALARITNCSRANISKLTKQNPPVLIPEPDGKINIDNEINRVWYETRMVRIGKDPQEKQTNTEKKAQIKKTRAKKIKKTNSEKPNKPETAPETKPTIESETDQVSGNEENNIFPENKDDEKKEAIKEPLALQKMRLEVENLREKLEKSKLENKKARAALVEIDTLGSTLFGYLIALNKNILSMPQSYVDEFDAAKKAGKSKTELTDILTKPISTAIIDSRDQIKKEIQKYKRHVRKNTEKEEKEGE
jgi:hypothetical protein